MKTMNRSISVNYLARVEGEGGLHIQIDDGQVSAVELRIFEPPRFFEAFLRGRAYHEVPDITARICGICPIAYQISSAQAIEAAFGIQVDGQLRDLRRLIYCGEWIESHVLHIAMLHAPDFLGFASAIEMARKHPDIVKMALRLKQIGNAIVTFLGGREIHPINVCVGGFYKVPSRRELHAALYEQLTEAEALAATLLDWTAGLDFPDFARDYEFVALRHPEEYAIAAGRLVSDRGLDIDIAEFEQHIVETHLPYSTALHAALRERGAYLVGPMARYSLNFDQLPPDVQAAAQAAGLGTTCRNPFQSIVVRAVETLYACGEALRIIEDYAAPDAPALPVAPQAGIGHGCSEAPRGSLYHSYRLDERGIVREARIVPPTAQNQASIEADLHDFVAGRLDTEREQLTWQCEQVVRNYDPCISCSAHFLKLEIEDS